MHSQTWIFFVELGKNQKPPIKCSNCGSLTESWRAGFNTKKLTKNSAERGSSFPSASQPYRVGIDKNVNSMGPTSPPPAATFLLIHDVILAHPHRKQSLHRLNKKGFLKVKLFIMYICILILFIKLCPLYSRSLHVSTQYLKFVLLTKISQQHAVSDKEVLELHDVTC